MLSEKTEIIKHLLRLGAFLQREGSRLLSESGLNQQQFVVLKQIQENKEVNQKKICSELLFEKSNISKIIKKLDKDKLIKITKSNNDSRVRMLVITSKGKALIKYYMLKLNKWNKNWLNNLSEKDAKQTLAVLNKL